MIQREKFDCVQNVCTKNNIWLDELKKFVVDFLSNLFTLFTFIKQTIRWLTNGREVMLFATTWLLAIAKKIKSWNYKM